MSFELFLTYQKTVTFWTYADKSSTTLIKFISGISPRLSRRQSARDWFACIYGMGSMSPVRLYGNGDGRLLVAEQIYTRHMYSIT